MDESAESKANRIREARIAVGLDQESVRTLIRREFNGRNSPRQLSSEDCDRLVVLLGSMKSAESA